MRPRYQSLLAALFLGLTMSQTVMSQVLVPPRPDLSKPRAFVFDVALSLDGETLASSGDRVRLFESVTGRLIEEKPLEKPVSRKLGKEVISSQGASRVVRFSTAENDRYASASDDGTVRVWRVGMELPEKELQVFELSEADVNDGSVATCRDLQFSPDGRLLAVVAVILQKGVPSRSEFRLWNLESGEVQQSVSLEGRSMDGIAFSAQGTKLAIATALRVDRVSTGEIDIYDIASWQLTRTVPFGSGFANGIAYSLDGDWLWIGGGECIPSGDGCRITGHLRKVREDGTSPAEVVVTDPQNYFRKISTSNDGKQLLTGSSNLQLRNTADGAQQWSYPGTIGEVYGASLSSNGEKAAFCQGLKITVIESTSGKLIKQITVAAPQ